MIAVDSEHNEEENASQKPALVSDVSELFMNTCLIISVKAFLLENHLYLQSHLLH